MRERFYERVNATAALMPPVQANEFLKMVEEERDLLLDERDRDPEALRVRLGIVPAPVIAPSVIYHQQGIPEMAMRTAIRAGIWESIFSLFRLFR